MAFGGSIQDSDSATIKDKFLITYKKSDFY